MLRLYSRKKVDIVGKKVNVLITDAEYKHTLGAVRSLGKAGYYVIAMSSDKRAQSFLSRYCNKKLICPNLRNEEKFIGFLIDYLEKNSVDVLIPVGYISTTLISKHKKELQSYVKIPVADYESMKIASNKAKTMQLANSLNIPTPKEYSSYKDIDKFPVVAKGIYESGHIKYINSIEELQNFDFKNYIFQEYIPGDGYGFYALFNQGHLRAFFMHQRIREYPITGGSSTCAKSIYDEKLKNIGLKLLKSLQWHGVAMVEFKKDIRDGEYKLMEINPKFWGSLDLSIACGVNFPKLLVEMALNGDIEPVFNYSKNIFYRWPFPDDLLHLSANPLSLFQIVQEYFNKNSKSNLYPDDFLPNLYQIYVSCIDIIKRVKNGNLRYPHGKPKIGYDC